MAYGKSAGAETEGSRKVVVRGLLEQRRRDALEKLDEDRKDRAKRTKKP